MATNIDDLYSRSPGTQQATSTMASAANAAAAAVPRTTDAVASTAGSQSAQAAHAAHTGYDAQMGTVDESTETSAGQMNKITSQDSALMQRAKASAMTAANSRGLINSSIAVGNAQGEMVDRATPLAQQDAAAYRNQSLVNQDSTNRAKEFGAGAENAANLANAQLETGTSQFNAGEANTSDRQNAQVTTQVDLANKDAANKAIMQQAENAQRTAELNAQLTTDVSKTNANNSTATSNANAEQENKMRQSVMEQNAEINRQFLAGDQSMDLASIQGRYQELIASNQAAAGLYDSYFSSISQAMGNENIAPDRLAQYVKVQQSMLDSGLKLLDSLNSIDINTDLPSVTSTGTGSTSTIQPVTQGPTSQNFTTGAVGLPPEAANWISKAQLGGMQGLVARIKLKELGVPGY